MKNNKLISVLLALLVCLSLVVSVSATESDLSFTLESPSSVEVLENAAVVGAGETFTVIVNIEKNPGVMAAFGYVEFDATKLELVTATSTVADVKVNKLPGCVNVVVGDPVKAMMGTGTAVTTTGAVAELTFKVLVETDEVINITLKAKNDDVLDANGKYDTTTASGDVLTVNAVGAEHKCDTSKTVDAKNAVEPTCTEAGKTTDKLCAFCGELVTKGETIEPIGHNWGEGEITTEPGCATMGVRTYTCANCGATQTDETVPATGAHTFGDWTVKTAATTEAEGVEARTCSGCGLEETRSIAKLAPTEPTDPVEPEPKNNTLLIVIIVVVVLAGAGVATFFVLKNKKK
jgi:hypothetical protein